MSKRGESGSMLMEAVAVLPLLVALIFGALQMAHIHIARQIVSYAAYAAARATLPLADSRRRADAGSRFQSRERPDPCM